MTQKERLVKLLLPQLFVFSAIDCEKLAEYLLDNGVIVPPCKVGDTVYRVDKSITNDKLKVFEYSIIRIDCVVKADGHRCTSIAVANISDNGLRLSRTEPYILQDDGDFERFFFLTREEAEQALKERDGK